MLPLTSYDRISVEVAVFEGVGHFGPKFQVEGDVPTNHLCTVREASECLTTMPVKVFTQTSFVADFLREKPNFLYGNGKNALLRPPLGVRALGATYDVHLRLIGKLVGDFQLVIIELFSLGAFVLSQYTCLSDRQTDRRTDGQTESRQQYVCFAVAR